MRLAEDIHKLREDILAAFDAAHDYYTHTKLAWRYVQQGIGKGHVIHFRNRITNNTVSSDELAPLAQQYVTGYLSSTTFQQFVSVFEDFLLGFLRLWLVNYPESLGEKQIKLSSVLKLHNEHDIVRLVVDKKLHELSYKRVGGWFDYLNGLVKVDCPTPEQIERIAEIKASRDILVHNKGLVDSVYVEKSMGRHRFDEGETLEIPEQYHRESWQLLRQVVIDIADSAIKKLPY